MLMTLEYAKQVIENFKNIEKPTLQELAEFKKALIMVSTLQRPVTE